MSTRPLTVGVLSDPAVLDSFVLQSPEAQMAACDLVELRLDLLKLEASAVRQAATTLAVPVLLTARHPAEGGQGPEDHAARSAMVEPLLGVASLIDIELQNAPHMSALIKAAHAAGVQVVGSFHDFQATPPDDILNGARDFGQTLGVDAVKIATYLNGPDDLTRLMKQAADRRRLPFSVMGMGPLGRLSRLALAKLGSLLNYGYLGESNAPGQWPAPRLKELLSEI